MDNRDKAYIDDLLAIDDIPDNVRQTAIAVKDGRAAIQELYRSVTFNCNDRRYTTLRADTITEQVYKQINAIEDEDKRQQEYNSYINDVNTAYYAEKILNTDPYYLLDEYLEYVTDKYLEDNYDECINYRDELQSKVYKYLRAELIAYMEADVNEIVLKIPKCIINDILHRANMSPEEYDLEEYDVLELDNPGFISYNPSYWIPENYHEFMLLMDRIDANQMQLNRCYLMYDRCN
jgi:hypothetical protein